MIRSGFKLKHPPKPPRIVSDSFTVRPKPVAVSVNDGRAHMVVQLPKDAPVRHEGYRRAVASLKCIWCGDIGRSQCAHGPALGRGMKAGDLDTFPLCAPAYGRLGCHYKFDHYILFDKARRPAIAREWAAQTRADVIAAGLWPDDLPKPENGPLSAAMTASPIEGNPE